MEQEKSLTIEELHKERKKELEKQLQILSKLSEKENLTIQERLSISPKSGRSSCCSELSEDKVSGNV